MEDNQIIVVQETEYTGAGKHYFHTTLLRTMVLKLKWEILEHEVPGESLILQNILQR